MGDAFTAVADDQNVFFYNPAGSVQRTGSLFNIVDLQAGASDDFRDVLSFVSDNEDDLKNFDTLSSDRQAELINEINDTLVSLAPTFNVGAPNMSYLSGPLLGRLHVGAGLFAQASGSIGFNPEIVTPSMYYDINADVIPMANAAFRFKSLPLLPGSLGIGANVKYLVRAQAKEDMVSVLELENFEAPPVQEGKGVGVDLGALYQITPRINLGLAVFDFGGTQIKYDATEAEEGFEAKEARTATIQTRWSAGLAWTPHKIGFGSWGIPLHDRLLLAADVKDFLNDESPVISQSEIADEAGTHLHLGAEYRWWFLRFRTGANQGYFTAGLGADWPLVKLDYAYYSDELGKFAGLSKHTTHRLSVSIGFGSGNTEARARIVESKNEGKVEEPTAVPAPAEATPAPVPATQEEVPEAN
jgi:hypothetical protein